MNDLIEFLKSRAEIQVPQDRPNFWVKDKTTDLEEAYDLGCVAGEVCMARAILEDYINKK